MKVRFNGIHVHDCEISLAADDPRRTSKAQIENIKGKAASFTGNLVGDGLHGQGHISFTLEIGPNMETRFNEFIAAFILDKEVQL